MQILTLSKHPANCGTINTKRCAHARAPCGPLDPSTSAVRELLGLWTVIGSRETNFPNIFQWKNTAGTQQPFPYSSGKTQQGRV